jgi:putative transposase
LTGSKKNLVLTLEQKRKAIEPANKKITVYRQCELLGLSRSSLYYKGRRCTEYNEMLMKLIDRQYVETPFYGIDKMTEYLCRQGHHVNHKRVRRLMRQMGLEAVYPRRKRGLSISDRQHKIYPYPLKDVSITRADQVWSADITYIRMFRGWLYLVAVMDWFSRYVLSWEVSTTLESEFCVTALKHALSYGRPEVFNTDQGSQFTSDDFTKVLLGADIQISMDGKGRVFDNIFVERLWRTVKVEEVYLRDYQTVAEARYGLGRYFELYNNRRFHQALDYRTPAEVYGVAVGTPVALRAPFVPTAVTYGGESILNSSVFCLDNG